MSEVECRRCGLRKQAFDQAPLRGTWGDAVLASTCRDCWLEWREEQTRLINHEGLQPFVAADKQKIYAHLRDFLKLELANDSGPS